MLAHLGEMRNILRDCEATLIPVGTKVTIPEGSRVMITQALGGSYTVNINGNLARIASCDADALGIEGKKGDSLLSSERKSETAPFLPETSEKAGGPVDEDAVWEALSGCYDPEIPVNIVDLGLIYHCEIKPLNEGNCVNVVMTLTAPGCGMGPVLVEDVRARLLTVKNVTQVNVELVFDPPWDRSMMSETAKLQLGMF